MVWGAQILRANPVVDPDDSVVYSPKFGGYPTIVERDVMEIGSVPLATFARFSEASMAARVRVVRDARMYRGDPDSYRARDYYNELRNTLRKTHWQPDGGSIDAFEAALDGLLEKADKVKGRAEHYKTVSEAYIALWRKNDAQFFRIPPNDVNLAGLTVHVTSDLGMRYGGNSLAVKLLLTAPKATRHYRQVVQFLTEEAYRNRPNLVPVIWDVRRQELLQRVPTPKDFRIALEGDAMAFQQIWRSLDRADEA
jgi:hypothetical protein